MWWLKTLPSERGSMLSSKACLPESSDPSGASRGSRAAWQARTGLSGTGPRTALCVREPLDGVTWHQALGVGQPLPSGTVTVNSHIFVKHHLPYAAVLYKAVHLPSDACCFDTTPHKNCGLRNLLILFTTFSLCFPLGSCPQTQRPICAAKFFLNGSSFTLNQTGKSFFSDQ